MGVRVRVRERECERESIQKHFIQTKSILWERVREREGEKEGARA